MATLDKITCDICGRPVEDRFAVVIRIESPHNLGATRISANWDACTGCGHQVGQAVLELYKQHHPQGA